MDREKEDGADKEKKEDNRFRSDRIFSSNRWTWIYIDSTLANTNPGGGGTIDDDASDLFIGSFPLAVGWWFNGSIDEVTIWDEALTPEEITWLYNNPGQLIPKRGTLMLIGRGPEEFRRR